MSSDFLLSSPVFDIKGRVDGVCSSGGGGGVCMVPEGSTTFSVSGGVKRT